MPDTHDASEIAPRIEGLLDELAAVADPVVRAKTEDLVRLLLELYGAGIERILEIVTEDDHGEALLGRLVDDDLVESLVILHDLHPVDVETRIQGALEQVRPYLGSHAGDVDYLGIDHEGVVHLALQGTCDGCPSSTVTVKYAIEKAISEVAPEVARVEVEGIVEQAPPPPGGLLQIAPLNGAAPSPAAKGNGATGDWTFVDGLGALLPGETRAFELGGTSVLVCSAGGALYAYRSSCRSCGSRLDKARLEDGRLICPACRQAYDVKLAGISPGDDELHLDPLPLLQEDDGVKIAVPSQTGA